MIFDICQPIHHQTKIVMSSDKPKSVHFTFTFKSLNLTFYALKGAKKKVKGKKAGSSTAVTLFILTCFIKSTKKLRVNEIFYFISRKKELRVMGERALDQKYTAH